MASLKGKEETKDDKRQLGDGDVVDEASKGEGHTMGAGVVTAGEETNHYVVVTADHDDDHQTIVSEVTLEPSASLFRGPLYPSTSDVASVQPAATKPPSLSSSKEDQKKQNTSTSSHTTTRDDNQEPKEFEKQLKHLLREQQQEMTLLSPTIKDVDNKKPNLCVQQQTQVDPILSSIEELPGLSRGSTINNAATSTPGAHAVGGPPTGMRYTSPHPTTRAEETSGESPRSTAMARIQSVNATLADDVDDDLVDEETGGLATGEETTGTDFSCGLQDVVLEGKPMMTNNTRSQQRGNKKMGWLLVLGCVVVGVAILFLVLGVVVVSEEEDQESSSSSEPLLNDYDEDIILTTSSGNFEEEEETNQPPSSPPPSELNFLQLQPFDDDLPEMVSTAILEDPESSFYKANQWLLSDPNYNRHTTQRKLQKFYMAMMYYATNGDSWLNNTHWLSYDVSECRWFSQSSFYPDSPYYEPNVF